jgi:hypothetical protein
VCVRFVSASNLFPTCPGVPGLSAVSRVSRFVSAVPGFPDVLRVPGSHAGLSAVFGFQVCPLCTGFQGMAAVPVSLVFRRTRAPWYVPNTRSSPKGVRRTRAPMYFGHTLGSQECPPYPGSQVCSHTRAPRCVCRTRAPRRVLRTQTPRCVRRTRPSYRCVHQTPGSQVCPPYNSIYMYKPG